jgi:periplasmic divalent cation tolerance protein
MSLVALLTTVGTAEDAQRLARAAVEAQLAACVHIDEIESVYRWRGAIEQGPEWRLLFKTTDAVAPALRAWIAAHHPYELPALYTLAVNEASEAYAAWVEAQTRETAT